jgi:hypothetical protein
VGRHPVEGGPQLGGTHRLGQADQEATAPDTGRGLDPVVGRQQDHGHGPLAVHLGGDGPAVQPGHLPVGDDHVRAERPAQREELLPVRGGDDLVAEATE